MNPQIVVIEDQEEVRENLLETLELGGYDCVGAADGHEGVRIVREHLPRLVLCDVMMPRLDGFGVLELLQAQEATRHIPFVFITARAEREDLRRGMNLGATDYITKPFFQDELLRVVELRLHQAQGSVASALSVAESSGPPRQLDAVLPKGRTRSYGDRSIIYYASDPVTAIYRVESGRVRLLIDTTFGKTLTFDSIGPKAWFGIDDALTGGLHGHTAAAYPDTVVTVVDKAELEQFLGEHPEVYPGLCRQFAQDLALRAEQLRNLAYYSVRKRVAEFLLHQAGLTGQTGAIIELRREDIAEAVATTPESVTRVLTEFKKEELVALPAEGGVRLINAKGLKAVPA